MGSKQRYSGLQTLFGVAHDTSCLFLCMLSIAEEQTGHDIDFITAYNVCLKMGAIDEQFYCTNQELILKILTGKEWTKQIIHKLPDKIPDKMYTVEKWYNPRTNFTHFKRRAFDTLKASVTVKEGKLVEYYTYTWR